MIGFDDKDLSLHLFLNQFVKSQQTYGEFNSFVINVVVNSIDHLPAIHRVIMDSIEELSLLLSMAARVGG